jgi:hypothetical protein
MSRISADPLLTHKECLLFFGSGGVVEVPASTKSKIVTQITIDVTKRAF